MLCIQKDGKQENPYRNICASISVNPDVEGALGKTQPRVSGAVFLRIPFL